MAKKAVTVRCRVSRQIADDRYAAGERYQVEAGRAAKYAALGVFEIVQEEAQPAEEKQADAPPNKMRGRPEDKAGWKNREGENVNLDSTPATGEPDLP